MRIDSYKFGRVVIDGETFSSDCILLGNKVKSDWWRKEGHLLNAEDLEEVIKTKPKVLIIGCGAYGVMKISEEAKKVLQKNNIETEVHNTADAVERFNELAEQEQNVAAALHLTC
jgi:hypothetical protein